MCGWITSFFHPINVEEKALISEFSHQICKFPFQRRIIATLCTYMPVPVCLSVYPLSVHQTVLTVPVCGNLELRNFMSVKSALE